MRARRISPSPDSGSLLGRQVEVEQHRGAVGRQQDVRRLQVAVEQAARVGMLEALGQPRDDPDRGLDGAGLVQEQARWLVLVLVRLE